MADDKRKPDEARRDESPQQGSKPANNEERHGQKLDQGKNTGEPSGDTGVFGSQAPFGGGPRK